MFAGDVVVIQTYHRYAVKNMMLATNITPLCGCYVGLFWLPTFCRFAALPHRGKMFVASTASAGTWNMIQNVTII
jgi:hypothetical protein